MTRPQLLPAPTTAPRRRWQPRLPWQRTRVTAVHRIRTDVTDVDVVQLGNLARNANVASITPLARTGRRLRVQVTWTDRTPVRHPARLRVEGGRRFLLVVAAVLGIPAALIGAGVLVVAVWGDTIGGLARAAGGTVILFLSVTAIAWILTAKNRRCPGLHCPDCPGQ